MEIWNAIPWMLLWWPLRVFSLRMPGLWSANPTERGPASERSSPPPSTAHTNTFHLQSHNST
eukprot:c11630_g1_i1 orf=280-465(+)